MADARVKDITSQVRLNLQQVGVENIQDGEIYRVAKRVVRDLLKELKPLEISFDITLVASQESYDISDEASLDIKALIPSWDERLEFVDNIKYLEITTTGNTYPVYCTIFSRKMYFRPIPSANDDIVTVWAYQTEPKVDIDEDTPPETPEYLDEAVILGICSKFSRKEFLEEYEIEKNRWKGLVHKKHNQPKVRRNTW